MFENQRAFGPHDQLVPGNLGIAYLSQQFELQKFLRVEQVLTYANTLTDKEADQLYEVCQIRHLLKRKTDQLSGGEKQRIAICRLLISVPRLILLDEPFSHLDKVHKDTLKSVIQDIGTKLKITCILVSHDPHDTLSWADKMLVMKDGKIVQKGKPEGIYKSPVNAYAAGLLGKYNLIPAEEFKTFEKLPGFKPVVRNKRKKNIFICPENFKLVCNRKNGLRGKVQKIKFFGSYYELEVSLSGNVITVLSDTGNVKIGDIVYVSLSTNNLWCI